MSSPVFHCPLLAAAFLAARSKALRAFSALMCASACARLHSLQYECRPSALREFLWNSSNGFSCLHLTQTFVFMGSTGSGDVGGGGLVSGDADCDGEEELTRSARSPGDPLLAEISVMPRRKPRVGRSTVCGGAIAFMDGVTRWQ